MLPNNWRYLRGDIYYADMEPHIGSEQGGKRPVVVLQNNISVLKCCRHNKTVDYWRPIWYPVTLRNTQNSSTFC